VNALYIRYSVHALERMRQRGIGRNLVELCIANPDRYESLDDLHRCVKKLDEKVLVIIYKRVYEEILIVTAYISTKVRKYLK